MVMIGWSTSVVTKSTKNRLCDLMVKIDSFPGTWLIQFSFTSSVTSKGLFFSPKLMLSLFPHGDLWTHSFVSREASKLTVPPLQTFGIHFILDSPELWIVCHVCGLQGYGNPPQYGGAYGQQAYAMGQQYPAQPATVTVQPAVYVTQGPLANPVKDYFGYSIFTMLCCCLPLGIAALIYSISVSLIHKCLYCPWTGAQPWKHRAKMSPQHRPKSFPFEYVPIPSPPYSWAVHISKNIKTSNDILRKTACITNFCIV